MTPYHLDERQWANLRARLKLPGLQWLNLVVGFLSGIGLMICVAVFHAQSSLPLASDSPGLSVASAFVGSVLMAGAGFLLWFLLFLFLFAHWLFKPRRLLDKGALEAYTARLTQKKINRYGRGQLRVDGGLKGRDLYLTPKMLAALHEGDTVLVLRERGKTAPLTVFPMDVIRGAL